jgi:hypothetical protein
MLPGGQSTGTPLLGVLFSPAAPPGAQFPLLPWPPAVPPPGYTALNHFLIGGSGGGGGGARFTARSVSRPSRLPPNVYQAGHGGTGGGGAVAIRTGGSIVVATTGILRSRAAWHLINGDSPGGAATGASLRPAVGSGGSFLLESSQRDLQWQSTLVAASAVAPAPSRRSASARSQAGSGATGFTTSGPGSAIGFVRDTAFSPRTNKADFD